MTMRTRGQFEIMGLAMLIVIIMLAALFFMTRERPDRAANTADYEYGLLAQSTVDIFLRTDVADCSGITMNDLVRDAVLIQANPCGRDSIDILSETAQQVIDAVSGSRYDFTIGIEYEEPLVRVRQCPRGAGAELERIGESRTRIIQTGQTVIVTLQFCPRALL